MKKNFLITGLPGVGKTTLIKRIIDWVQSQKGLWVRGFYTSEFREGGKRQGFEIVTTENQRATLAHRLIPSLYKVGKYGVDVLEFERIVMPLFEVGESSNVLWVIDEIGKMECFSEKFTEAIRRILDSTNPVVATVAYRGSGFIAEVKRRPDVTLFTLKPSNREQIFHSIIDAIGEVIMKHPI